LAAASPAEPERTREREVIERLLLGIRWWAAQEDGVPEGLWPAYVDGCHVLGWGIDGALAAPRAAPREGEDARLRAIEEQLDDLAEAVWRAAAEPKCVRCGHPKSWHRLNDAKDDSLFRCIGYDCAAPGKPKPPCGCPDFLAAAP